MKPAVFILNYNMPETTGVWVEYFEQTIEIEHELFIVDNGSDDDWISETYADITISVWPNLRTTGGAIVGYQHAAMLGCTHAWMISTSTLPPHHPWNYDPLARLVENVREDVVCVAPSFFGDSDSWPHQLMMTDGTNSVENHWLIGMFGLWDLQFMLKNLDLRLSWSWGTDFDLSYIAFLQQKLQLKHNGVPVRLREDIGYTQNRMGITYLDREKHAREEMERVLTDKYGKNWRFILVPHDKYRDLM